MKRFLLVLATINCIFTACENGLPDEESGTTPSIPKIELSQQTVDVEFEPNTYTVKVTSPYSWRAVSENDWITVESTTGIAGTEQLKFSVERNEQEKERKGTIVVLNSNYNLVAELYIIQKAFVPSEIIITPETINFTTDGGTQNVTISTNFEYEITTDAEWLSIERKDNGINITASAYFEVEERLADIVVFNEKYGISKTIKVVQSAFIPQITVEPDAINFTKKGGEQNIEVNANFEHIAETKADWISISKIDNTYSIIAKMNVTTESRSADISILSKKYGISKTVKITQDGADEIDLAFAKVTISPTSFATDLEGGEHVITVTSNAAWTVSCDQTDVTIEPLTGGGNGTVTITVPAATQRVFKVVFNAQKQTLIPAVGISTISTAKAEVAVSQNAGGVNLDDYLFYEDCGEDVEKNSEGYWPYVDMFTGWNPLGYAVAAVTYAGNSASVRASGANYQPTEDAMGISGQPYVFLNKVPASAYFVIENLDVKGGSNYIFAYNVQCQAGYSGGPTFATVENSLVHLELGYDGTSWDTVDCTFTPNGGNGWYLAMAEFKVAADATKLYARFSYEAPASSGGCRLDDFKLVNGGNGDELDFTVASTQVIP